ncbi:MAG TPA: IPT/TIG domain-containing protein, partial [Propionicimonas sp.]|nr:IPT/TIG domain-containing protein [Propionicimonas sp.]
MHPFPTLRARAISVITLAIAAGLMCQAPAYAEATTPSTPTTATLSSNSRLSSTNGVETGGAAVVITGSNFVGVTAVAFGTTPATSFTASSPTSITAVS